MSQYLLSTYSDQSEVAPEPASPEQMAQMMEAVVNLEADMDASGTFVFGGQLHGADTSTVVRPGDADALITDGPFAESKEHIAGFYIIDAADLDEALTWAKRVTACIGRPIEVRPFAGSGRVVDQMQQMPES